MSRTAQSLAKPSRAQPHGHDEIHGRTDRQACPIAWEGRKEGGGRFDPQECGSTDDSAEQNVWSITDQSALTHTEVGGHHTTLVATNERNTAPIPDGWAPTRRGRSAGALPHARNFGALGNGGERAEARTEFASASGEAGVEGWRARALGGQNVFSFVVRDFSRCGFLCSFFLVVGGPTMTGKAGPGARENGLYKTPRRCASSGGAAAIALPAACSGITNTRSHTPSRAQTIYESPSLLPNLWGCRSPGLAAQDGCPGLRRR